MTDSESVWLLTPHVPRETIHWMNTRFVSEQTKHTWFPFLCYEETLIRDACHQSFSASTAISNSTRSTENNRFYVRKIDSSKSARSRHYYLAKSARSRHYHLASEWTIARYIYIANQYPQSIVRSRECCREKWTLFSTSSLGDEVVNNLGLI